MPARELKTEDFFDDEDAPKKVHDFTTSKPKPTAQPIKAISADDFVADEEIPEWESGAAGAVRGITAGTSPYIEGAARGGYDALTGKEPISAQMLLEKYRAARDAALKRDTEREEANPKSYMGGLLGGGFASSFIPGLGALNATKGAGFLANAGKAALQGGIIGGAYSPGDLTKGQFGEVGADIAKGGALGGTIGGGMHALGAGARALGDIEGTTRKAGSVAFNLPEEVVGAVQTARKEGRNLMDGPKEYQLAQKAQGAKEQLKDDIIRGSKASRNQLELENTQIDPKIAARIYAEKKAAIDTDMMGIETDPGKITTSNRLGSLSKEWSDIAKGTPAQVEQSSILNEYGRPMEKVIPGTKGVDKIPAGRWKDEVQMLQREAKWPGPTDFPKIDSQTNMELQGKFNDVLKGKSEAYRKMMEQVANDSDLLSRMEKVAPSEQRLLNVYRRANTDQHGPGQLPMDTLRDFDSRMNTNFVKQASEAAAQRMIDKTGPNGSRNVNLYSNTIGRIPGMKALAPIIGGTVDRHGGNMMVSAVEKSVDLQKLLNSAGKSAFGQAVKPLFDAAAQGDKSAALTLYLLKKQNPDAFDGRE